jgi:hypothetical protein
MRSLEGLRCRSETIRIDHDESQVEECAVRRGESLTQYTAELEWRRPISDASPVTLLTTADLDAWIVGPREQVVASARVPRRSQA